MWAVGEVGPSCYVYNLNGSINCAKVAFIDISGAMFQRYISFNNGMVSTLDGWGEIERQA